MIGYVLGLSIAMIVFIPPMGFAMGRFQKYIWKKADQARASAPKMEGVASVIEKDMPDARFYEIRFQVPKQKSATG